MGPCFLLLLDVAAPEQEAETETSQSRSPGASPGDPSLGPGRFLFSFFPGTGQGNVRGQISHLRTGQSPSGDSDWWVRDPPPVCLSGKQVTGTPAHCRSSCAPVRKRKVACASLPAVRAKAATTPAAAPELPTIRLQDKTPTSHPGGPEGLSWP